MIKRIVKMAGKQMGIYFSPKELEFYKLKHGDIIEIELNKK